MLGVWRAEWIKLPKLPLTLAVFGIAGGIVGLKTLGFLIRREEVVRRGLYNWEGFLGGFSQNFNQMLLPLVVAALVAFSHHLEAEQHGLRLCLRQPPSRGLWFGVKNGWMLFWLLVMLSSMTLGYLICGALLFTDAPVPWEQLGTLVLSGMVFSLPTFAAQQLLTVLLRNPLSAMGLCLFGLITAALGAGTWIWGWPWYYSRFVGIPLNGDTALVYGRALGTAFLTIAAATVIFSRRDVT